jgi:hypothetical protein
MLQSKNSKNAIALIFPTTFSLVILNMVEGCKVIGGLP